MPEITDPFTPLFHELVEPLIRLDLTGVQFRILLWVARNTYGWGGAFFAPFSWRKIAQEIGADRRGVAWYGSDLLKRGILRLDAAGNIGIDKRRIRSLALGPQSPWDSGPMGPERTKEGTTVPGPFHRKERKKYSRPCSLDSTTFNEASPPIPPPPSPLPDGFDSFWAAYPRKVAKAAALKAWLKLVPDAALRERIAAALEAQKWSAAWTKDGGQFIPHPATWLNGERWTDEALPLNGNNSADGLDLEAAVKKTAAMVAGRTW